MQTVAPVSLHTLTSQHKVSPQSLRTNTVNLDLPHQSHNNGAFAVNQVGQQQQRSDNLTNNVVTSTNNSHPYVVINRQGNVGGFVPIQPRPLGYQSYVPASDSPPPQNQNVQHTNIERQQSVGNLQLPPTSRPLGYQSYVPNSSSSTAHHINNLTPIAVQPPQPGGGGSVNIMRTHTQNNVHIVNNIQGAAGGTTALPPFHIGGGGPALNTGTGTMLTAAALPSQVCIRLYCTKELFLTGEG